MRGFVAWLRGVVPAAAVVAVLGLGANFTPTIGISYAQAQSQSAGCVNVNAGALNGTIAAQAAHQARSYTNVFAAGDVLVFTWTNSNSVSIQVNGLNQPGVNAAGGTFTYTVTAQDVASVAGGAMAVGWSAFAPNAGQDGTMTVTCNGGTVNPLQPNTPPPPGGHADEFLNQNAASAAADLTQDSEIIDGLLATATCAELREALDDAEQELLDYEQGMSIAAYSISSDPGNNTTYNQQLQKFQTEGAGAIRDMLARIDQLKAALRRCAEAPSDAQQEYVDASAHQTDAARAADALAVAGGVPDSLAFFTPLAYAPTSSGLLGDLDAGAFDGWSIWARGSISGLSGSGANTFAAASGRIDLGASRPLGNGLAIGGFIGWDGTNSTNATTGGTTSSNAIHIGGFGSYRLPGDIVLSVAGGAAFGSLVSTIGNDSGTTGTQRGFVSAKLSGTIYENGPWTIGASGSLFLGAEHQNAFTTGAGVAVPEQTVTKASATASTRISYALPTETPMEAFTTLGLSLNGGTMGTGLSGTVGAGLTITSDVLRATITANVGGIGGAIRSWSLSATVGGTF